MNPAEYKGNEWKELLRTLNAKEIKKTLRGAVRAVARKSLSIARGKLSTSGLNVKGSASDWKKGIRQYVYNPNKATGFLITVKARAADRKTGKGEKSMHKNRRGFSRPVLMWAEDGTRARKTKTQTKGTLRKRKGHATGRMGAYSFLESATPGMTWIVEREMPPEIERSVERIAAKSGFI